MDRIKNTSPATLCSFVLRAICLMVFMNCITAYAQSNNTVQGCYNDKTGALRKDIPPGGCTNKETAISWNIIGPQGVPGPQGPQGIQGVPGSGTLRIVDTLGNEVGVYMPRDLSDSNTTVLRLIPSLDNWFLLTANKNGFQIDGNAFLYESTDCTGQAYSNISNNPDTFFIQARVAPNGTFYYPNGPRVTITPRSSGFGVQQCSGVPPGNVSVSPVGMFPVSDFGLTPPFKLSR